MLFLTLMEGFPGRATDQPSTLKRIRSVTPPTGIKIHGVYLICARALSEQIQTRGKLWIEERSAEKFEPTEKVLLGNPCRLKAIIDTGDL